MTWVLDEQRRMLRDSAQTFLAERAPVTHLRKLRDSADAQGYSPELWAAFAEQGYSAALVPEAHGGLGLGVAEAGLIAEQIGHTIAPSPFFSTAVLAAWLLKAAGSEAQQKAWLPRIAAAETIAAEDRPAWVPVSDHRASRRRDERATAVSPRDACRRSKRRVTCRTTGRPTSRSRRARGFAP